MTAGGGERWAGHSLPGEPGHRRETGGSFRGAIGGGDGARPDRPTYASPNAVPGGDSHPIPRRPEPTPRPGATAPDATGTPGPGDRGGYTFGHATGRGPEGTAHDSARSAATGAGAGAPGGGESRPNPYGPQGTPGRESTPRPGTPAGEPHRPTADAGGRRPDAGRPTSEAGPGGYRPDAAGGRSEAGDSGPRGETGPRPRAEAGDEGRREPRSETGAGGDRPGWRKEGRGWVRDDAHTPSESGRPGDYRGEGRDSDDHSTDTGSYGWEGQRRGPDYGDTSPRPSGTGQPDWDGGADAGGGENTETPGRFRAAINAFERWRGMRQVPLNQRESKTAATRARDLYQTVEEGPTIPTKYKLGFGIPGTILSEQAFVNGVDASYAGDAMLAYALRKPLAGAVRIATFGRVRIPTPPMHLKTDGIIGGTGAAIKTSEVLESFMHSGHPVLTDIAVAATAGTAVFYGGKDISLHIRSKIALRRARHDSTNFDRLTQDPGRLDQLQADIAERRAQVPPGGRRARRLAAQHNRIQEAKARLIGPQ